MRTLISDSIGVFVQMFKRLKGKDAQTGVHIFIKLIAIQIGLGLEDEFDRWHREEHPEQVSKMPGWRSTRFELIFKAQGKDNPHQEQAPKYLAIDDFEEGIEVKRIGRGECASRTKRVVQKC